MDHTLEPTKGGTPKKTMEHVVDHLLHHRPSTRESEQLH